jgi:hypothetical protein
MGVAFNAPADDESEIKNVWRQQHALDQLNHRRLQAPRLSPPECRY